MKEDLCISDGRFQASDRAATPGRILPVPRVLVGIYNMVCTYHAPSRSSSEAPPPVLTWLTLASASYLAASVAVSPPPMIVVAPAAVAAITASRSLMDGGWVSAAANGNGDIAHDLDPLAKLGNSNTPMGPFQTIVLARSTAAVNLDQRRSENV